MAGKNRTPQHAVEIIAALQSAPYKFGFFQALRRLECIHRDKPPIGKSLRAADDPVRLAHQPDLSFAPATLASFQPGHDGRPHRLTSRFLGLFGPNGPMPVHLTEYARDRMRNHDDPTLIRFADVFHHRVLSLFYRAWADVRPAVSFDRPEADRFSGYVGSLFGLGLESLRGRDSMNDLAKLHFSGRLTQQTRNAEGLQAILGYFFRMPVEIEQFVGDWLRLPAQQLCRLGESPATGTLGAGATIGARVWSCQYKFTIIFGPMGLEEYRRLLPGGASLKRLVAVVRNYIGNELSWDVNLILKKEEVPPLKLGQAGQLGWTTWLPGRAGDRDADELYLNPMEQAA